MQSDFDDKIYLATYVPMFVILPKIKSQKELAAMPKFLFKNVKNYHGLPELGSLGVYT